LMEKMMTTQQQQQSQQQSQQQNMALTTSHYNPQHQQQQQPQQYYSQQQRQDYNDQQMEEIQYVPTQPQQTTLSGQKRIKMTPEYQISPPPQAPSQLALPVLDSIMYPLPDISLPDRPLSGSGPERAFSQTSIASFDPTDLDDILGVPSDSGIGMGIDMDTSINTSTSLLPAIDGMGTSGSGSGSTDTYDPLHAGMSALALAPAPSTLNTTNMNMNTHNTTTATSAATSASHETILDMNPNLRQQFQYALSCLPIDMQRLFVERLISMVSNPETMQNHIEAVNALASAAARVEDGVDKGDRDVPLQLAVATLGSFLTQYAKAKNTRGSSADGTSSRLSGPRASFFRQLES